MEAGLAQVGGSALRKHVYAPVARRADRVAVPHAVNMLTRSPTADREDGGSDQSARSSPNVVDRSAKALCLWIDSSASDFTRTHVESGIFGYRFSNRSRTSRTTSSTNLGFRWAISTRRPSSGRLSSP